MVLPLQRAWGPELRSDPPLMVAPGCVIPGLGLGPTGTERDHLDKAGGSSGCWQGPGSIPLGGRCPKGLSCQGALTPGRSQRVEHTQGPYPRLCSSGDHDPASSGASSPRTVGLPSSTSATEVPRRPPPPLCLPARPQPYSPWSPWPGFSGESLGWGSEGTVPVSGGRGGGKDSRLPVPMVLSFPKLGAHLAGREARGTSPPAVVDRSPGDPK